MLKYLIVILSLLNFGCERARDAEFITTVNGIHIDTPYHVTYRPSLTNFSLVLFINSASCKNTISFHSGAQFSFEGQNVGIMTVDKAGTRTGPSAFFNLFNCSDSYWQSNYPSARTQQILGALKDFQSKNLGWNGDLYLVGAYEGALPAIELAREWSAVKGLILLSIGSGLKDSGVFKNDLACLAKSEEEKKNCLTLENSNAQKLEVFFSSDPTSAKTWTIEGLTGTSKWFREMLAFDLNKSLDFKLPPTLIIHGGRDFLVPVETLDEVSKRLPDVEVKIFSDLNQGWMDSMSKSKSQDVQSFVRDWIKKRSEL
jgi:hypothetical protein